jgi:hypothetical protein
VASPIPQSSMTRQRFIIRPWNSGLHWREMEFRGSKVRSQMEEPAPIKWTGIGIRS